MRNHLDPPGSDRGVTLIEFALLFGLLLLLAIGAFEYGMVFRDSLTVTASAREAGRVAASTANYGDADCVILEAAAGALQSLQSGEIDEVQIYESDATGSYPGSGSAFINRYSPWQPTDPGILACSGSDWYPVHIGGSWNPPDRVNTLGLADWIGVRITYDHNWITGFLWFSGQMSLSDDAVFRIEPPAPS